MNRFLNRACYLRDMPFKVKDKKTNAPILVTAGELYSRGLCASLDLTSPESKDLRRILRLFDGYEPNASRVSCSWIVLKTCNQRSDSIDGAIRKLVEAGVLKETVEESKGPKQNVFYSLNAQRIYDVYYSRRGRGSAKSL